MNFPRLSGSNVVELIRNWRDLWNNQISGSLRSLELTAGPGIRIDKRPVGQVISAIPQTGKAAADSMSGLFQVTPTEDNQLEISGGWVNRNGLEMSWYPGGTVDAAEGILCICSEPIDKLGNWTGVYARIVEEPTTFDSPIAEIFKEGDSVTIQQYPVTVAYIFAAKRCPIAEL